MIGQNRLHYTVSVVVPTYNRSHDLSLTLQALCRQNFPGGRFEVIVVDDGSSDDTFQVARAFEQRIDLKYIYQPDRGFRAARARNCGCNAAEGEYIVFLDCGKLPGSQLLAAHVAAQRAGTRCAVIGYVYGFTHNNETSNDILDAIRVDDIDESIRALAGRTGLGDVRERLYARCNDELSALPAPWALFWSGNISVSRQLCEAVGGFDENYVHWGAEDVDFGLALHQSGARFHLCRAAAAIQFPHAKSRADRLPAYLKNKQYLHQKYQMPETEYLLSHTTTELNLNFP